jgi:hypothetical protein
MILQSEASASFLSDLLETSGPIGSNRSGPLAGLRRLRFSFFSDEPTLLPKADGASFCPRTFGVQRGGRRVRLEIGPVAQLVRARA